jgi:phosphopantothenoylcysteine decarboxylase / phosphopantothenate---cysteine ligase
MVLKGKKIVLGVTGGIAVYKAVDLVSKLVQAGAQVRVVMSEAATKLVTPLTFKEISGHAVAIDMWCANPEFNVEHIALVEWADFMILAPATANVIGKMAAGIADDLLTTTILACQKPIIICPAMNSGMYNKPVVQENIRKIMEWGIVVMPPASGYLACGTIGIGRLPEPPAIVEFIKHYLATKEGDLRALTILVTAAGTREAIDPVRYIGNRSSGKMGYAVAKAAADRGAKVILVSGPSVLTPPAGVKFINVESTQQMMDAVLEFYDEVDVVVKAAAVADYKSRKVEDQKIKKCGDVGLNLVLDKNPDILQTLGARKTKQFLVGFAAETQNLLDNAKEKIRKKNLDMIVANDVTLQGAGFNADTNVVKFLFPDGIVKSLEKMPKSEVAEAILDIVKEKTKK